MTLTEEVRNELNNYIKLYGLSDKRTINKSQELDKLIVIEQKMKRGLGYERA